MKKLTYLIIGLSVILMLVSCSGDEEAEIILPEERFEAYIELWREYNFDQMYDMLSEETKATYNREEFVDRYQKIYQDLEVDE